MLWDPFLMKKLIKNEICGSVNSARMHCSRKTDQKLQLLFMYRTWTVPSVGGKGVKKKKKKEGKCRNLKRSKRGSKLCLNKNIPCKYFLLMLPCGFLHLMLSCDLYTCHFYVSGGDSKTWHMWLDFICWLSTVDMSSIGN